LIEASVENERKVIEVLALLPDGAAKEIRPGEISDYMVVRVCDEITVDLMAKACGVGYDEAKHEVVTVMVEREPIPYASLRLFVEDQANLPGEGSDRLHLPAPRSRRVGRVARRVSGSLTPGRKCACSLSFRKGGRIFRGGFRRSLPPVLDLLRVD